MPVAAGHVVQPEHQRADFQWEKCSTCGDFVKTSILLLSVLLLAGCLDWGAESEALRLAHVRALENAAATNQYDVIPPLEVLP